MKNKVVLGAGIAGIGAYYADSDASIYEAKSIPGGLCGGFEVDGFYFDNAVHLSFTDNELVRSVFDKTAYYTHQPEAVSWYHKKWLRHPAQNNLFPCATEDKVAAIKGFVNRKEENDGTDFATWTRNQYGDWLYENLFKPYNEKYWCVNLEELGIEWIGNRIYKPTLEEVLYGSYTDNTPNTYYAKEMRYPIKGRYISFVENIINQVQKSGKLHCEKKVVKIQPEQRCIMFQDGTLKKYDELYSSIPLSEMADIVEEMPTKLKKMARELEHTGVVLISVGFNRVIEWDKLWFYFYDSDILAARAYMPSIKTPVNVPEGCSSVQFEIYFNAKEGVPDKEKSIVNCKETIKKIGMARDEDIIFMNYKVLPYGNVILKKGTEKKASEITNWLKENGIIPIGRFGEWKYFWSDQAFMSGYRAVMERKEAE